MPNGSASSPTSRLRTSEYGRGPTPLATYSRRSSTCSRAAVPVGSSPETSRPGRQSTGGSGGGTQTEPSSGSTPPYASPASASSPGAIRPTAARATRNTRGSSAPGRRPGRSLGRGVADQGVDGLLVAGHGIVHATILSARGVRAGCPRGGVAGTVLLGPVLGPVRVCVVCRKPAGSIGRDLRARTVPPLIADETARGRGGGASGPGPLPSVEHRSSSTSACSLRFFARSRAGRGLLAIAVRALSHAPCQPPAGRRPIEPNLPDR